MERRTRAQRNEAKLKVSPIKPQRIDASQRISPDTSQLTYAKPKVVTNNLVKALENDSYQTPPRIFAKQEAGTGRGKKLY